MTNGNVIKFLLNIFSFTIVFFIFFVVRATNCRSLLVTSILIVWCALIGITGGFVAVIISCCSLFSIRVSFSWWREERGKSAC